MEHLPAEIVAGYVDRTMSREERRSAETHLASCDECRAEVVAVARMTSMRPSYRVPLAVAASIGVLVVGGLLVSKPEEPVLRAGHDAVALQLVAPRNGETIPVPARMTWRSMPEAMQYRVTVLNTNGDVVAEKLVTDSTTLLGNLAPHSSLKWYLTAITEDGQAITSPVTTFRTR